MQAKEKQKTRPIIGLGLGSGAMRGLAHIGVLQVMEENHIPIDLMSGCSMGAVVGGIYCCGVDPFNLEKLSLHMDQRQLIDVTVPRIGLLRGKQIQSILMTLTQNKDFSQTRIPFYVLATDIEQCQPVILQDDKLHEAIRASISIPGVFHPHIHMGRKLVDGGVIERVALDVLHQNGADITIGVDVGYRGEPRKRVENVLEIIMAAMEIMDWEMNRQKVFRADFMIVPNVRDVNPATLDDAKRCIERGREAAIAAMPEIKYLINEKCKEMGMQPLFPDEDIQQDFAEIQDERLEYAKPTKGQTLQDIPSQSEA